MGKRNLVSLFLITGSVGLAMSFDGSASQPKKEFAQVAQELRIEHARELLGRSYDRSVVKGAESYGALEKFIYERVSNVLKGEYKEQAWRVTQVIIEESGRHRMDPFFVIAVIEHESKFNPEAIGSHGEIGLMQIIPATGEWVARKHGLSWHGPLTLKDMPSNIRIGTAYLSNLRERFHSRGNYYLAAYNMGATKFRRSLSHSVVPREYSSKVMNRYLALYSDLNQASLPKKSSLGVNLASGTL